MAKTYVLDRVAADLARGSTHPAIQRLSSLVAAYPNDLDLRRRLAAAHRRVGNRIQAGRWDYLTIGADRRDTTAFERAFPSAVARLREVSWPHRAGQAATTYARKRLAKLMDAAAAERPARAQGVPSVRDAPGTAMAGRMPVNRFIASMWLLAARSPRRASVLVLSTVAILTTPLVVVGLVTVVQWIV